jgi:plastocyanin
MAGCLVVPSSAGARNYTFREGPIVMGGYQVSLDTTRARAPKVDGYITRMRAFLVDARGRPVSVKQVMLHHVLFTDKGRRDGERHDGTCPGIPRERIYGTGEEHSTLKLPPGYGIPIHRKDRWLAAWMVMSHQISTKRVFIEYHVTVETRRKLTPVKAYWLDVTGCRGPVQYSVPGGGAPGSIHTKSVTWKVPANGRLVAGGAHLHGGAADFRLLQPRCGNRTLVDSKPLYGLPDNVVYHVFPVLHEPGPIDTSWFTTAKGIPLARGERLTAQGEYDGERPHAAVMAVDHVYMARSKRAPKGCPPLPSDLVNANAKLPGRTEAPAVTVPLTGLGPDGRARTIDRPPGPITPLSRSATINVHNFAFDNPNLSLPLGASLTWKFNDSRKHNVITANGPEAFASLYLSRGKTFSHRFTRPGTYRMFCTLHPMTMHEVVDVQPAPASARAAAPPPPDSPAPTIHW